MSRTPRTSQGTSVMNIGPFSQDMSVDYESKEDLSFSTACSDRTVLGELDVTGIPTKEQNIKE